MLLVNEILDGDPLAVLRQPIRKNHSHHGNDPILEHPWRPNDLVGVAVFGSPASETDKRFTAEHPLRWSPLRHRRVIVATEGLATTSTVSRSPGSSNGVPTVGVTWAAEQGLVVGNEYLVALVETNRSADSRETLRLSENTATAQ
jgi:hypothetical protein